MQAFDVTRADEVLGAISEPRLRRFFAYVEEKRAGRLFAARRDLDPLDFPYILGEVVLLDVLYEPLRFRYRLVGAGLAGVRGYDLTGKFVHDHPDPEYRAFMLARYREVIERRRVTADACCLEFDGKLRAYQALRIPLSEDGETVTMIAAAVVIDRREQRSAAAGIARQA